MKKYFIVGSPTESYYPWLMYQEGKDEPFLYDSVEDAKNAIADMYPHINIQTDDFWIGEKIEFDIDEVNLWKKQKNSKKK